MTKKTISIQCEGAALIDLNSLTELQGNLKELDDIRYEKLKSSILELGFSFPMSIWKSKGKNYIIDAHQRGRTLRRMRDDEGFKIPKLPVVWVEARDRKDAAKKVLAATSQYGQITPDGLFTFMKEFKLDIELLKKDFTFPEIDFPSFELTFFPETTTVSFEARKNWDGMPEFEHTDKQAFRSLIVHFHDQEGVDSFGKLIKQTLTDKTRMLWYPEILIEKASDKRYGSKS